MIKRLTFMALVVDDMNESVKFYTEKLGLTINTQETVPGYYTQFDLPTVAGFALISGLDMEGVEQAFDTALLVDDVDQVYARCLAEGVDVVTQPRDIPWGRTFLLRTPDGHVLRLYSAAKPKTE